MTGMAKKRATYTPDKIKTLRERLGLNQTEAGEKVGVSQNLWSAWERGTRTPSAAHLILLQLLDSGKIRRTPPN